MALTLPSAIPSSACVGSVASATWTSSLAIKTKGTKRIEAGKYWSQGGASWEFTLKNDSLVFNDFSIPGAGAGREKNQDPRLVAEKALGISKDNKTMTLSVPYPTLGGTFEMIFDYGPNLPKSSPTTFEKRTSTKGPQVTESNKPLVDLIIKGSVPCVDPREAAHSKANPGDPTIASLCSNAKITPGPEAWKKYDVPKYMASILSVAGPRKNMYSPTNVDGALVIHSDVNPPGAKCTYTAKCDSIGCKDVRDSALGSTESIQRYLAYQGVVNLNNYLWNCYNALFKAGTIESLMSGDIVTTFFSNPKPDATWVQVVGGVAPLLGLASALLAPFTVPSAIFGAAGGIVGLVLGQGTSASLAPVVDARFTEESNIKAMVGRYLAALADGVGHAYDETIGRSTSIYGWTGVPKNNMGDQGVFGDGFFSNNNYIQDLTTNLYPNMVKIFTYKSINFAWKDSGAFIVFVPYGRDIMGPDGNIIHNFGANYCKTQLGDRGMVGKATNCDAGGGMAALVRAEGPSSGFLSQPQGYDKKFNVLPRLDFSVMGAIEGSVASWRKGDFNFDAGDPYKDALSKDTLSKDQLREIAQMPFEEKSPGMFNIPVCQTFDLRYFPYIDKKSEYRHCTACSAKPAVGGTAGSEKRFFDSVPEIVLRTMGVANSDYTQAYGSTPKCAKDLYTG